MKLCGAWTRLPPPDATGRGDAQNPHGGPQAGRGRGLAELADKLEGYSGADVQLVCRDAAMAPMRAAIAGKSPDEIVELDEGTTGGRDHSRDSWAPSTPRRRPSRPGPCAPLQLERGIRLRARPPPAREAVAEAPAAAPPRGGGAAERPYCRWRFTAVGGVSRARSAARAHRRSSSIRRDRVRATEHAPRDPSASSSVVTASRRSSSVARRLVERRAESPHLERESILSENASRHGNRFARQVFILSA